MHRREQCVNVCNNVTKLKHISNVGSWALDVIDVVVAHYDQPLSFCRGLLRKSSSTYSQIRSPKKVLFHPANVLKPLVYYLLHLCCIRLLVCGSSRAVG